MTKIMGCGLLAFCLALASGAAMAANSCETDLNRDGKTDEADVAIFQSALGKSSSENGYLAAADLDGDGAVTVADYGIFLSCN